MKESGVSEVIGTLLMLAITVTLFSSVFFYVSTLPPPPTQVYASFQVKYLPNYNNGSFILYLQNLGGESLNAYTTKLELLGTNPSFYVGIDFSNPEILSQLKSNYFEPGNTIVYKSWWNNVPKINSQTTINLFLIDTLNNQLIYSNLLQGIIKSLQIVGFSYTPVPFYSNQPINAKFFAYVIYNPNNNVLPTLTISIPGFKMNGTMQYYSPFEYMFSYSLVNLAVGNYTVYINATLGKLTSYFKGIITVLQSPTGPFALRITSISLSNPDPVHGSTDMIFISVSNPSSNDEKFQILLNDYYPYNNSKSLISTNLGDPFWEKISAYSSTSFVVTWYNVGGNGFAEGNHTLFATILNPTPQIPTSGNYCNLTVMPRILVVDDEAQYTNTPNSVFNYYYNILNYMDYNVSTEILPNPQTPITLNSYDLVIWITGYSQSGIGAQQLSQINNFVNVYGGSFMLIGDYPGEFSGIFNSNIVAYSQSIPQTPIKYNNFTKISPNTLNMYVNIVGNITPGNPNISSSNNILFFTGSIIHYLASLPLSINPNNYPSAVYGVSNNGRFVLIGYELTRMYLYQQYYILNKAMMWLSNISVRQHLYDLALIDMEISTHTPLFLQSVNITFYIMNLSPGPFGNGNTILEYSIGNKQYFVPVGNITQGNGSIVIITVSWIATLSPGIYPINAYLNYYHSPQEVNYNNNVLNNLVNVNIFVKYSVLVVWVHKNGDNNNITGVINTLKNLNVAYTFFDFNEQNVKLPNNFNYMFEKYNLVIIDFNNTGKLSGYKYAINLSDAIYNYIMNPNTTIYPYSLLFLGERTGYALEYSQPTSNNVNLLSLLNINSIQFGTNIPQNTATLYGLSYQNLNINLNNFQINVTDGYGFLYDYSEYWNLISLNSGTNGLAILGGGQYPIFNHPLYTGRAVIENVSNVIVGIVPFDFENIVGLIQPHTYQYSPQYTSSNPLYYQNPSQSQYTKNMFMMNLLLAFRYHFNSAIPYIPYTRIFINSPYVSLNNYYLISGIIRNLGDVPTSVILQAYEESSIFTSETIYLPAESNIPFQVIWKPTYASSPNPEYLRLILIYNGIITPLDEAIISTPVYYFYDDGSSLSGWVHYDIIADVIGEYPFGLTSQVETPQTNILTTNFANIGGSGVNSYWTSSDYYIYPYSYYIKDAINYNNYPYNYLYLQMPTVYVPAGSDIILSWWWKYSIAFAQNGLFVMVNVNNNWYQVDMPYNNNPDLGNVPNVNNCNIYEVYNGVSGGGTFTWTFHKIQSVNDYLYVMNPSNGLPLNNPIYIGNSYVTFYIYYVQPDYVGNEGGSTQAGSGAYIDDVMLAITNGGLDGWRVINPSMPASQLGISYTNYLGFPGAPTYNLIADFVNENGYPGFVSNMWDNLITPPIDLVDAVSAQLSFTFKANIQQGWYGDGWPPDFFLLSVSNNNGETWSWYYSPPTYPTNPIYNPPGSNSGGGTIWFDGSNYWPANGANGNYWLTVTFPLNSFVGENIMFNFQIFTNNGNWGYGDNDFIGHAVNTDNLGSNPFLGFYMTNIIVSGYMPFTPIYVQTFW